MKQYLDLLEEIIYNGVEQKPAREGMPATRELFGRMMKFNLSEGFPLLTTKKMYFNGIVGELLWFLRGDINIKYLLDNNIHIWDKDAYKFYCRKIEQSNINSLEYNLDFIQEHVSFEEYLDKVKRGELIKYIADNGSILSFEAGECGNIYGYLWRTAEGDQVQYLIDSIKTNPESRYHILSGWIPSKVLDSRKCALPPCHLLYQFNVQEKHGRKQLNLIMYQRSCDFFLGVPFNIASSALFTHILAKECNLAPGELTWVGASCHVYDNHLSQCNEQLSRTPKSLPRLEFDYKPLWEYKIEDFQLEGYDSYPAIKAPLSVGV